jgi:transposase InsO family protein
MLKDVYPETLCGRDRFYRLIHDNNLMLKPGRRRHTTSSNHNYRKYKNLIKGLTVSCPNRLWVADITYIETDDGVLYLHLLTDAYTHEIIGWVLSESLVAEHTVSALKQAIELMSGYGLEMLIHHSDRGAQYCSHAYVGLLNEIGATISMTEDHTPTDNAIAERVNGIIKQEWLYRMKRPENYEQAHRMLLTSSTSITMRGRT